MINLTTGVLYAKTPTGMVDLGVVGLPGSGMPQFEKAVLFGKTNPLFLEEGHIVSNFSYNNFITTPSNAAVDVQPFVIDYSKSWEIGVLVKLKEMPSASVALVGTNANGKYYEFPSIEMASTRVWLGISADNTKWDENVSVYTTGFNTDTWYFVAAGVNGNEAYVKYTEDFVNYVENSKTISVNQHSPTSGMQLAFGCNAWQSRLAASVAKIDLFNTYVKNDGAIIWGAAKYSG